VHPRQSERPEAASTNKSRPRRDQQVPPAQAAHELCLPLPLSNRDHRVPAASRHRRRRQNTPHRYAGHPQAYQVQTS